MIGHLAPTAVACALLLTAAFAAPVHGAEAPATQPATRPASVLDFTVKDIAGNDVALSTYRGQVLLIVNTASKCGNTPQYKNLEALYEKYKSKGFAVLAFPANEFGRQEPGTNDQIKEFCSSKYAVSFPLFSKIVVKGEGTAPLYAFLTSQETNPKFAGDIKWNFAKFLIARDGTVVNRYEPKLNPEDKAVVAEIEVELAKDAPAK